MDLGSATDKSTLDEVDLDPVETADLLHSLLPVEQRARLVQKLGSTQIEDAEQALLLAALHFLPRPEHRNAPPRHAWKHFDTRFHAALRESFPMFEPRVLVMHTWGARVKLTGAGVGFELAWINPALADYVETHLVGGIGRGKGSPTIELLREWLEKRPPDGLPFIGLQDFLSEFACDDADREALNAYYDGLEEVCLREMHKVAAHSHDDAELGRRGVRLFRNMYHEVFTRGEFTIHGVRHLSLGGIKFRHNKRPGYQTDDTFDLYAALHLDENASTLDDGGIGVLSAQGVFIPVSARRQLYHDWREAAAQAEAAGIVARNFSHNLGSHAAHHVVKHMRVRSLLKTNMGAEGSELVTKNQGELLSECADFIDYLSKRAEITAYYSTLGSSIYTLPITLTYLESGFEDQTLLKRYLCKSERCDNVDLNIDQGDGIKVEIPCGFLGLHALFALIENFARNSAKHAAREIASKAIISVSLRVEENRRSVEAGSEFDTYVCYLTDEAAKPPSEARFAKIQSLNRAAQQYFSECPADSVSKSDRGQSLGLMEMNLWAAFLRRRSPLEALGGTEAGPCIEYLLDDEGHLAMRFELLKGKELVWLQSDQEDEHSTHSQFVLDTREPPNESLFVRGRWVRLAPTKARADEPGRELWTPLSKMCSKAERVPFDDSIDVSPQYVQALWLRSLLDATLEDTLLGHGDSGPLIHIIIRDNPFHIIQEDLDREFDPDTVDGRRLYDLPVRFHCFSDVSELSGRVRDGDLIAVWDRHGEKKNFFKNQCHKFRVIHYECFSTPREGPNNENHTILSSLLSDRENPIEYAIGFLLEAALVKVLLIDERMCPEDDALWEYCARAGIFGLDPVKEPNRGSWSSVVSNAQTRFLSFLGIRMPFVCLSIHSTLYSKIRDEGGEVELEGDLKTFLQAQRATIPYVSTHSGRGGVSESERGDVPYFPVTSIREPAFDHPSKLMLVQTLLRGGGTRIHE